MIIAHPLLIKRERSSAFKKKSNAEKQINRKKITKSYFLDFVNTLKDIQFVNFNLKFQ